MALQIDKLGLPSNQANGRGSAHSGLGCSEQANETCRGYRVRRIIFAAYQVALRVTNAWKLALPW